MSRRAKDLAAALTAAVGAALLLLGLYLGEGEIVLRKAVNICLECIGLGQKIGQAYQADRSAVLDCADERLCRRLPQGRHI